MLDGSELNINLQKMKKGFSWTCVFKGDEDLNVMEQGKVSKELICCNDFNKNIQDLILVKLSLMDKHPMHDLLWEGFIKYNTLCKTFF